MKIERDENVEDVIEEVFGSHREVDEDTIQEHKTETTWLISFLAQDSDAENPLENCDAMGEIYTCRRSASAAELARYHKALGRDPDDGGAFTKRPEFDAVPLECYSHGGESWHINGTGMLTNDPWDNVHYAGVWVPDKYLLEELRKLRGQVRRAKAVEYARQALETFNDWLQGDVYGIVHCELVWNEEERCWEEKDHDSCWGYYGHKWAKEELESEFKHAVKSLEKKELQHDA